MPWNARDAKKHTRKAKSKKSQRQWAKVANSVLSRGGSEGSAVRQANAVVKKRKAKSRHKQKSRS